MIFTFKKKQTKFQSEFETKTEKQTEEYKLQRSDLHNKTINFVQNWINVFFIWDFLMAGEYDVAAS